MPATILLSSAYLPPPEYFSLIFRSDKILIEKEENYLKQSYRNRCYILSSHGRQLLSVPVYLGSLHKTPIKDIRIDYSKRWQQVHLRAIKASYGSAPYFQYYFENIETIILKKNDFLIDLNMELIDAVIKMLRINTEVSYTTHFETTEGLDNDYRYCISPKIKSPFKIKEYIQVFNSGEQFINGLSIVDLIFNQGPEARDYL
jgi:hypothetical protein